MAQNQGAKKFRLVAVITRDTSLDLMVLNTLAPLIAEAYDLVHGGNCVVTCY
ncbi:hypothetical protein PILCRDRAFT_810116, partial [Piloderma croceum F 1598]